MLISPERRSAILRWVALIFGPILAYYPIVFLGYTIARDKIVSYLPFRVFGVLNSWPVQDSYASALQDEPWLVFIKHALKQGSLPLVNMHNGLGAPFLETMQSGALYVLNPLLLLLPTDSSLFFDLFVLLHVILFTIGVYLFCTLYARPWIAVPIALLVGTSGVSYINSNMVHFRDFTWFPFAFFAVGLLVRGQHTQRSLWILFLSLTASISAGSIQGFVLSLMALGVYTLIELYTSSIAFKQKMHALAKVLAIFFGVCCVGAVIVLPFYVSLADGNLYTSATGNRSIQQVSLLYMLTWVVPKIKGLFPDFVLNGLVEQVQPDIPTVLTFAIMIGVFIFAKRRKENHNERIRFFLFLSVAIVALLKTAHLPIFDVIQHVPLLNAFKFAKYHLYIVLFMAALSAMSLEQLMVLQAAQRKRVLLWASGVLLIILAVIFFYAYRAADMQRIITFPFAVKQELFITYIASLLACVVFFFTFFFKPKRIGLIFTIICIAQAVAIQPMGWFERLPYVPPHDISLLQSPERVMQSPYQTRTLSGVMHTNQSLFFGVEQIGVWDAILNAHYRSFMMQHFEIPSPDLSIEILRQKPLTANDIQTLRFLGVEVVNGYAIDPLAAAHQIVLGAYAVEDPLPPIFLMTDKATEQIQDNFTLMGIAEATNAIQKEIQSLPTVYFVDRGVNHLSFQVNEDFHGALVLNQAFSTYWLLEGQSSKKMFDLFPVWQNQEFKKGEVYTIRYWPRGLTYGLWIAVVGVVVFAGVMLFDRRRQRKQQ